MYCDNGHLVFYADRPAKQRVVVNAGRVLVALLAGITATQQTSWPLYVISAGIGLVLIVLPLRKLAVSRTAAAMGWLVAIVIAVSAAEDVAGRRVLHELALLLVLLLVGVGVAAVILDPVSSATDFVERALGASALCGLGLLLVGGVTSLAWGEELLRGPAKTHTVLVFAGALTLAGAVSACAACGIVRGIGAADYRVPPLLQPPRRRTARKISVRPAPRSPAARGIGPRLAFAVDLFLSRLSRSLAGALHLALNLLWRTVHITALSVVRVINAVDALTRRILRAIASAAVQALRLLVASISAAASPLRRWLRKAVGMTTALVVAAAIAAVASNQFADYLISGGPENAASALFALALFPVALGAIWWTATAETVDVVKLSLGELLGDAGPYAFLTALAIGWALGIAGWLGVGEIRPGVLTYAGTAILAAAAVYLYAGSKNSPTPASQD